MMADAAAQQFFMINAGMTNAVGRGPRQSISAAIDESVARLRTSFGFFFSPLQHADPLPDKVLVQRAAPI